MRRVPSIAAGLHEAFPPAFPPTPTSTLPPPAFPPTPTSAGIGIASGLLSSQPDWVGGRGPGTGPGDEVDSGGEASTFMNKGYGELIHVYLQEPPRRVRARAEI
eukprot:3908189-Rhodomonas_salina.1